MWIVGTKFRFPLCIVGTGLARHSAPTLCSRKTMEVIVLDADDSEYEEEAMGQENADEVIVLDSDSEHEDATNEEEENANTERTTLDEQTAKDKLVEERDNNKGERVDTVEKGRGEQEASMGEQTAKDQLVKERDNNRGERMDAVDEGQGKQEGSIEESRASEVQSGDVAMGDKNQHNSLPPVAERRKTRDRIFQARSLLPSSMPQVLMLLVAECTVSVCRATGGPEARHEGVCPPYAHRDSTDHDKT
eukprot:1145007-Rhodomonas_salina.2